MTMLEVKLIYHHMKLVVKHMCMWALGCVISSCGQRQSGHGVMNTWAPTSKHENVYMGYHYLTLNCDNFFS